jgi:hypothetical protein
LRGTFVVGSPDRTVSRHRVNRDVNRAKAGDPSGGPSLIASLIRLAALPAMVRGVRDSAADAATRAGLAFAAGIVGGVGVLCLSYAGLTLLQREMDPAAAWAIVGGLYGAAGGGLYLAATRRRRG